MRKIARISSRLLALSVAAFALAAASPLSADSINPYDFSGITDPSDLHVGTGANTAGAQGLAGDPTAVNAANFDLYYNSHGQGQLPIGTPFWLIIATPVYSGSSSANAMLSPAQVYTGYGSKNCTIATPCAPTGAVTVTNQTDHGLLNPTTTGQADPSLYRFLGFTPQSGQQGNSSFNWSNMTSCDTGVSGCPNSAYSGTGAPLAGKTITGYEVFTWDIGTTTFSHTDLINFDGIMPIGSYIAAVGVNVAGQEAWSVPFTEAGFITHSPPTVSEAGSLALFGSGLLMLGGRIRRVYPRK